MFSNFKMGPYVVLAFTFAGVRELYSSQSHDRQPLGPKMCKQLCRQIIGCTFPTFNPTQLACRVTDATKMSSTQNGILHLNLEKVEDRDEPENAPCSRGSKIFYSRARTINCETHPSSTVQYPEARDRLLTVPIMTMKPAPFHQIVFPQLEVMLGPLALRDVRAVAYLPWSHRIVLSIGHVREVQSYNLDSRKTISILKRVLVRDIAVDGRRHHLFLLTDQASKRVIRTTPNGTSIRTLHITADLRLVALDPRRGLMFVCTTQTLYKCKCSSTNMMAIEKSIYVTSLSYDPFREAVYFNDDLNVIKLSPYKRTQNVNMTSLDNLPSSIIVIHNVVYMSTERGVFALYQNSTTALQLTGNSKGYQNKLCHVRSRK